MKHISKNTLEPRRGLQVVRLPEGSQILKFAEQNAKIVFWAVVPDTTKEEDVVFKLLFTGDEITDNLDYTIVGPYIDYEDTVVVFGVVFHIYRKYQG